MPTKNLLFLKCTKDITQHEEELIKSLAEFYGLIVQSYDVSDYDTLKLALNDGHKFDYLYLASHGCENDFSVLDDTQNGIRWVEFGALICKTECLEEGAILFHSCCLGGIFEVAYKMIKCCENIEYICGPRSQSNSRELVMVFSMLLFFIEQRKLDPLVAIDKIKESLDVRVVCYDRRDVVCDSSYNSYCERIQEEIDKEFDEILLGNK
jgi:hypothetical protein